MLRQAQHERVPGAARLGGPVSLTVALLLGLASATGFAPLNLWPATLIAFALWIALVAEAPRLRGALARGWWFGFGQFVLGLNWIATSFTYQAKMPAWLGWIAVAVLSLYLAVYPAVAAGLAWRFGRKHALPVLVLLFAAAWMLTEWLRATMFTGFAWNPLGVIFVAAPPMAGLARVVGTYGLSGLAMLEAGALVIAARGRPVLGLGGVVATGLLGWATAPAAPPTPADAPRLRIVQPNIGQDVKWRDDARSGNLAKLAALSGPPGPAPRLLLWPEAAVSSYLEEEPAARARLAGLLGPRDLLMTGGVALRYGGDGQVDGARNSLFLLDASGRLLGRYDKAHLVPYGEYLPMRPILSRIGLSRLAPGDIDFLGGPGPRDLILPGIGPVGIQICYEMIFSGRVVDEAHRPRFVFNPSNDAWFGRWGPPQHLAQARLRAIEEGLPIVRATPTGISAVIAANGRLLAALPWRTAGAIDIGLPAAAPPTPFSRFGNLLPLLFGLALVAAAIAVRRRGR